MTRIIGDTTSGLSLAQATELGIGFIPQIVVFEEKSFRDDTEIDSDTFVKMLESSAVLPKTAAPPPALYTPIFEELQKNGDNAVIICPSSKLSGTVRSATTAKNDFPDLDVRVIDTGSVGSGLAMELIQSMKWVKEGKTIDEIEAGVREMMAREHIYAVVDTLEYLYKGGRIGGASKLFGDILQIKPILTLRDGGVETFEKQRTKKKALSRIVEIVEAECPRTGNKGFLSLSLQEKLSAPELEYFRKEFKERIGVEDVPFYKTPASFMVHAGPSVIFISFFVD
ncbi:MAG: DegV family protein [Flexilinea sp.]|jgi:DegV family protein with EDD domain